VRRGYIKSSPQFFRLIKRSAVIYALALLCLAFIVPAPLQEQGSIARVPNPVKSAWFLLWIQELVSYSKYLIYAIGALAAGFLLLPWLPGLNPAEQARWLPNDQRTVTTLTIVTFTVILALTMIAMFFRGENWTFSFVF
jgi:hypothetical protein